MIKEAGTNFVKCVADHFTMIQKPIRASFAVISVRNFSKRSQNMNLSRPLLLKLNFIRGSATENPMSLVSKIILQILK